MVARQFPSTSTLVFGAFGSLVALAGGAAAGTGHGVPVAAALLGLAVCGAAIAIYVRDPVRALIWVWIIVVLNAPLTTLAGADSSAGELVRYSDEALVVLLVSLTACWAVHTNKRIPLKFILPALGVALCGLLGAAIHHVPLAVSVPGAWLGLKLWIMICVAFLLPWKPEDITRIYKVVTTVGVIVAGYGFADFLTSGGVSEALNLVAFHIPAGKGRADAVHSIFGGPNPYSLFMSILFALTFARFAGTRSKADLALSLVFAVSVLLTLRLKGFLSLAAVVIVVALAQQWVTDRSAMTVALIGSLLIVGGYSLKGNVIDTQVSLYTSSGQTARAQLYSTGERIASDNLPLGVGFGRFASYPSRMHYSPVYDQYELSSVYGLSRTEPKFISDTAWPSVMGETGYAGLAAYAFGLVLLILAIVRRLRNVTMAMRWVPLAALCTLAVILTDSIGSPALFDWMAATSFALILGPAMIATRTPSERPPT